jgi:hypothetical protein
MAISMVSIAKEVLERSSTYDVSESIALFVKGRMTVIFAIPSAFAGGRNSAVIS